MKHQNLWEFLNPERLGAALVPFTLTTHLQREIIVQKISFYTSQSPTVTPLSVRVGAEAPDLKTACAGDSPQEMGTRLSSGPDEGGEEEE